MGLAEINDDSIDRYDSQAYNVVNLCAVFGAALSKVKLECTQAIWFNGICAEDWNRWSLTLRRVAASAMCAATGNM